VSHILHHNLQQQKNTRSLPFRLIDMSVEGHDSADGHVDAVPDFLQPIRKEESTVGGLDIKDASERRPSDQKHVGQGDTSTGGAKSAVADEVEGGKILGSVFEVCFLFSRDVHSSNFFHVCHVL
jgi:hypothetical protein